MSKHTPGPWTTLKDLTKDGEWVYLIGSVGYRIAGNIKIDIASDTAKANAHLIAAAPEMFEAIEAFIPLLWEADQDKAAALAIDLIAKARGEL